MDAVFVFKRIRCYYKFTETPNHFGIDLRYTKTYTRNSSFLLSI
jgi:hypothetical protein